VIASARAVLSPLSAAVPATAMPVFSSGQSARQVHATWDALGHADLIFAAGGGIMGHPGGPSDGVRSIRDAWDAAMAGVPLDQAARESRPLAQALERYGS
jgi:ribulose-bisphosphate carboxylase large chain